MDGDLVGLCEKYNIKIMYVSNSANAQGNIEILLDNFICRNAKRIPDGIYCSFSTKKCEYFYEKILKSDNK